MQKSKLRKLKLKFKIKFLRLMKSIKGVPAFLKAHKPTWMKKPSWLKAPAWVKRPAWMKTPAWLRKPAWMKTPAWVKRPTWLNAPALASLFLVRAKTAKAALLKAPTWWPVLSKKALHIGVITTSFVCLNFGFVNCSPVHDMNGALNAASSTPVTVSTTLPPLPSSTLPTLPPPASTSTTMAVTTTTIMITTTTTSTTMRPTTTTTVTMPPGMTTTTIRPTTTTTSTTTTTMKPTTTTSTSTTTTTMPVAAGPRYQFTCNSASMTASQMQRLSRREYSNTIRDLLGQINSALFDATITADIAKLPIDQTNATINNNTVGEYEATVLIYTDHINNYFQTAYDIGGKIAANSAYYKLIPGTAGCLGSATVTSACITNFITGFGKQVFRRPLTSAEVTQYTAYYNSSDFSTLAQKIQGTIAIFLQSPDFLYRIFDQGTLISGTTNTRTLSAYEYAQKISYLITGSMPDATLMADADSGAINSATGATTEIGRLLALPTARPAIARFFKEWLQYDTMPDMTTFPTTVSNGLDMTTLGANMVADVDNSIQSLVFDYNASYQDLMSTKIAYVAGANIASIYGVANPNGLVSLGNEHTGILSRAAFMAKQSQPGTSPVKRGRFMLTAVLCQSIGNPPPGAPAQAPTLPAGVFMTTRDRYNQLTVQDATGAPVTSCVGCHGRMNPLGYTYESFDPLGRVRSSEPVTSTVNGVAQTQSLPINTSSVTNELDVAGVSLGSYVDLHNNLSTSDKGMACMSQQWFQFIEKRAPATATFDGCYMNEFLNTAYGTSVNGRTGGQGSVRDMIQKTILTPRFRTWYN